MFLYRSIFFLAWACKWSILRLPLLEVSASRCSLFLFKRDIILLIRHSVDLVLSRSDPSQHLLPPLHDHCWMALITNQVQLLCSWLFIWLTNWEVILWLCHHMASPHDLEVHKMVAVLFCFLLLLETAKAAGCALHCSSAGYVLVSAL